MARPTKKTTAKAAPSKAAAKQAARPKARPKASPKARPKASPKARPNAGAAPAAKKPAAKKPAAKKPAAKKPVAKAPSTPAKQSKPAKAGKAGPASKPPKPSSKAASAAPAAAPKSDPTLPRFASVTPVPVRPDAKPPPKVRRPHFNDKELAAIRQELAEHSATLERELEELDIGSLHVSQSELSGEVSFDEEYADAGTFTFERERDLSLSNNIRDLMDKVGSATKRLADGSYGVCERCGNGIDKARLRALPYSVMCISCKQREERTR